MPLLLATALVAAACAAPARTTAEDYRATLASLALTDLRPGPSGDLSRPDHANNVEAKAVLTSPLPDPLRFADGRRVTAATWPARRRALADIFTREVVGAVPADVPAVTWRLASATRMRIGDVAVVDKHLVGTAVSRRCPGRTLSFHLRLITPADRARVPVVLSFQFVFPDRPPPALTADSMTGQLVAAGFAHATFNPAEVQPDNGAGLSAGIIGLANGGALRRPGEWGALRAWAWGASRALDYLRTDPAVDGRRVAIEGLSRYGKATLVALAFEPRFAAGFAGSSGEGGASPYRRVFGERLENVAGGGEYHWMAPDFLRYAGPRTADDLPVDANDLIALAAPRPLLLGNGNPEQDWWTDPRGAFLAGAAASPVWTLLGAPGYTSADYPEAEVADGTTGLTWRRHTGGHSSAPNWPFFIDWSKRSWAR